MRQLIDRLQVTFFLLMVLMIWTAPCQGFEFQGFGAVTAQTRAQSTDSGPLADPKFDEADGAFSIGQLDFFVSRSIGERLELLTELVVEGDPSGEFAVDLERFQIGYLFSNLLTVRAGRIHTPLGFWNATYHHGAHLQPSIDRPDIIKFEDDGGPLPVHLIGLSADGYQKLGLVITEYDLAVGNGARMDGISGSGTLTPNSVVDNDGRKAVAFHVDFRPTGLPDAGFGISGYLDRVEIFDTTVPVLSDEVNQTILGGDLHYDRAPIQIIGEYYDVRDSQRIASPLSGLQGTFHNSLFFIHAGYMLLDQFTLYARYEQQNVHTDEVAKASIDPYFNAIGAFDRKKIIGGLRFDISLNSAIKLEARHIDPKNYDEYQQYAAQWTIAF
jgi:hypothetical protein